MKTCLVHFGMHKTGSSSIQQTLYALGRGPGWVYAHTGRPNASLSLLAAFGRHERAHGYFRRAGLSEEATAARGRRALQTLADGLAEPGRLCILSGEGLTQLDGVELAAFADWLRPQVDDCRLLAYARPVRAFMESSFQERVKTGTLSRFAPERLYPGYRGRFEKFDQVFGAERVQVLPFDPARLVGGDVVLDFAAQAGIALPAERIVRANASLSRDALGLLFIYNRHVAEAGWPPAQRMAAQQRLVALLRGLPGPRARLAAQVLEPVIAAQAADLVWIARRAGAPMDGPCGPDNGDGIASEDDLLRPTPAALAWLAEALAQAGGRPLPAEAGPRRLARRLRWLAQAPQAAPLTR